MTEITAANLDVARRWYAEELRCTAPVLQNEAIVRAFATVPREQFLPPGPWRVIAPGRETYTTYDAGPVDVIVVNAGVTHPAASWLDALKPGGRLLLPLTADDWGGIYFRIELRENGYSACAISHVGIFHCLGAGRDAESAARLQQCLRRRRASFRRCAHCIEGRRRKAGPSGTMVPVFWLSTMPLASSLHSCSAERG